MSQIEQSSEPVLAAEFFAAKDGVFMAVPSQCGLKEADTLVIDGLAVWAVQKQSVMTLAFPDINESVKASMVNLASSGRQLAVAEFAVTGVLDAYGLRVVIQ